MMEGFIEAADRYLLTRREHRDRKSHYVGSAESCLRQQWYEWTGAGVTDPAPAGGEWKMAFGKKVEELVEDVLEDAVNNGKMIFGRTLESFDREVSVERRAERLENPIRGRVDFILHFRDGGEDVGLEVKSSYGMGIKQVQSTDEPKPEHLAQVFRYGTMLDIERWYLIYFGRDNGYRTEFPIRVVEKGVIIRGRPCRSMSMEWAVNRWRSIEESVEKNKIPDREFYAAIKKGEIRRAFQKDKKQYQTDWQCGYCKFKTRCWAPVVWSTGKFGTDNAETKRSVTHD